MSQYTVSHYQIWNKVVPNSMLSMKRGSSWKALYSYGKYMYCVYQTLIFNFLKIFT